MGFASGWRTFSNFWLRESSEEIRAEHPDVEAADIGSACSTPPDDSIIREIADRVRLTFD